MNINKNYYLILNVNKNTDDKEIRKNYLKLSKIYHPDINKDIDISLFNDITEAYTILCSENRIEYDTKSKFGQFYDESIELLNVDFDFDYEKTLNKSKEFIKNELLDIYIKIDDSFNSTIEYERWVSCKACCGTGIDSDSKIIIKDEQGNILKIFDAEDGCDFCEGSGKDYNNSTCSFCFGEGKVGLNSCRSCKSDKRILGKQKLKGIKLTGDETKINNMGNSSKFEPGRCGHLILIKNG